MPAIAEYDLKGLNHLVSSLSGALFSNGNDGDLHRILKTECGQLAWDISERLGHKTKDAAAAKAEKDVKRFLTDRPIYSNLTDSQQYSSYADFTWLQAGPHFLVGINDEDNQPGASAADALAYLRIGQKSGSRGKACADLGARGKQHLMRINRTRVSRSTLRQVVSTIEDKLGTLRASFAFTAVQLLPGKRVAEWIRKHFATRANGRAIFNDAGLSHPTEPYLEFGSTAVGVESNPRIAEAIKQGVEHRKHLVIAKLKKVIAGYAYDWNTGRVFNRREAQTEET